MIILAGVLSFTAAFAFDERPNLTGVWTRGQNGNGATYKIEQRDDSLTIRFNSEFLAGSLRGGLSGTETYEVDGSERERKNDGKEIWTTALWRGQSLVILRVAKDGYRVTVTRESWTPSADGLSLVKNRRVVDMDGVNEKTEVLRRQ